MQGVILVVENSQVVLNQILSPLTAPQMQAECQMMVDPAEWPRGTRGMDQGVTGHLSGFSTTRISINAIQDNVLEIRFALDTLPTENFSNPYCPDEFLIDKSSLPAARMIREIIPINRAIESIECEPIIHRSSRISFYLL
jgi:hypothetical protein